MKNVLIYNDFIGSVDFSADDEVFFGKVEGIDDLVSFEGSSVSELKAAFESSVNDYIEFCKKSNKQPEKSYKGSFNVRMPQEIHMQAKRLALMNGISLNQFVQRAVEESINREMALIK